VIKYSDLGSVVQHIKSGEKPLTLYMFSRNRKNINRYVLRFFACSFMRSN
jgi:acyl-CoA reductase-like NAD-dependent aldehyde dehydrogenase